LPTHAQQQRARVVVDVDRCHGCLACMVTCSLVKEGQVIPSLARVQVALDVFSAHQVIRYCHQCKRAPCAQACPRDVIRANTEQGYWEIDEALCDGCGACIDACPFEAILLHPAGYAIKCDTCAGNPQCVASCPSGALSWLQGVIDGCSPIVSRTKDA